jgi:hypothetical protein
MEIQLSELYLQIYNQVNNIIHEEWTNVILYGEVCAELSKTHFYYFSVKENKYISGGNIFELFPVDYSQFREDWRQIIYSLEKLHQTFIDHGQEPWTNLTMRFDSNGKFSIEYHYDDFTDISPYTTLMMWNYMIAKVPFKDSSEINRVNEFVEYLQKRNRLYNNLPVQRIETS